MEKSAQKKRDNVIIPEVFARPRLTQESHDKTPLSEYVTLRNVVAVLGAASFFIVLGSVASLKTALLFAALLGLTGLLLADMYFRRKWERELVSQFKKINDDYERLVRETARNRNDLAELKRNLVSAGTLAQSYGRLAGNAVEQRMVKALADQLSSLAVETADEADDGEVFPFAVGALEKEGGEGGIGSRLTDEQVLQLVSAAVKQDRIDLFMQPVVNLPQRKLRFYEMFSRIRIRPDVYLPAERYIEVALRQDLIPSIDNLLLLRILQAVRNAQDEGYSRAYFCNISSVTLNDPKFMGDLVEFIAQNRTLAPRLVFEFSHHDLATMGADVLPVLEGLTHLGCRFSVDQVKSLSFDFAFLKARNIRFVKVDAELMLEMLAETGGLSRLRRLKADLDRAGIDLIAEKIESEKQLLELLDVEIDYGQGYLFGKPALYEGKA